MDGLFSTDTESMVIVSQQRGRFYRAVSFSMYYNPGDSKE